MVFTDRELFGATRLRRLTSAKRVVTRDLIGKLQPGDHVVHVDHGIARYVGMTQRTFGEDVKEYLQLDFAGTDKIFLPADQIGRITRYAGGPAPALSKLGGTEWERTKTRVRRAVGDLARELVEIYAARESAPGFAFSADSTWQRELEESFPYTETPDQARSIEEVKADMLRQRPMDRLVVGDVGYGKTEVALRAAFKAIQDGKQVAVLVPTTVLAQQHLITFQRRLAAFPIEVAMLSRFVSKKEQERIVGAVAEGSVDILIGTHRILSKDIGFADLGLLVVDEEQRFGVSHKERIKAMRREVDVLTLSATPIPRTLHLSLVGIRDLSVIETPPEARLPIQTRIAEDDDGLVRDAIRRELDRGGQVFYVHNRVETIEAAAERVRRLVPGARDHHRPRPDGGGHARARHARLLERPLRRPGVHDDHRVRPRHPEREHDHHRPRRHVRAGPALPATRPRRPIRPPRPRLPPPSARDAAVAGRPQAAARDLLRLRPRRRLPDRAVATSRSAAPATSSAPSSTGSWRRSASRCTRASSPRRSTCCAGVVRRRSRHRSGSTCRGRRSCPMTTSPTRARSSRPTGASPAFAVRRRRRSPARRPARPIRTDPAAGRGAVHRRSRAARGRGGGRSRGARRGARVTLKWARLPDRHAVSVALQVAGLRPDTASNQVRIPVAAGRDPIEVALRALAASPAFPSGLAPDTNGRQVALPARRRDGCGDQVVRPKARWMSGWKR